MIHSNMSPLGPLIVDIPGTSLTSEDRKRLTHPMVGGIILFSRNFADFNQLKTLIADIHALRDPRLLVMVDHEGGRVQRWHEGFTSIPAMGLLGELYETDPAAALKSAYACGQIIAAELTNIGVDLNFAPVLDLDYGNSTVLRGGRSFHRDPQKVIALTTEYIKGLRSAGMSAVGKHFPGHGGVVADSHFDLPTDDRTLEQLHDDILPFEVLIKKGLLAGIMTAHILYPAMNDAIATLSTFWIQTVLRQQLGFKGVIFSDDVSMKALECVGDYPQRVRRALQAGCDLILLCNNPEAADQVLKSFDAWSDATDAIKSLYYFSSPVTQKEVSDARTLAQAIS